MRTRILVVVMAALLYGGTASAQVLSIEFQDGRVRLVAENVPVSRILAEWARLGGTTIVHGERIPGGPVTLQLTDVPERQALDVVLRAAAGYMVAGRQTPVAGKSVFEKILVLPTTARAPTAASLPPPQTPPPQDDPQNDGPDATPLGLPPGLRGRVQPGAPGGPGQPLRAPDEDTEAEDAAPPRPTPANPFNLRPGTSRPGVIVPPPREQGN